MAFKVLRHGRELCIANDCGTFKGSLAYYCDKYPMAIFNTQEEAEDAIDKTIERGRELLKETLHKANVQEHWLEGYEIVEV